MEFGQRVERHDERVRAVPERAQVDALADPSQHGEVIRPAAVQVVQDDLPGGRE